MFIDFENISNNSRVWVYGSETEISQALSKNIHNDIESFLSDWKHHNNPLICSLKILFNRFIIIALDDSKYGVGGCSLDSLQRQIQLIEKKYSIILLNRLNVFCLKEDIIECIPLSDLKDKVNNNTLFYDLTIQNKNEISSMLKPVSDGWCEKYI
tara:strand:+ start:79925 stop:80389 length:465 start_codon:yes stop_codon:yes gene_type:complete